MTEPTTPAHSIKHAVQASVAGHPAAAAVTHATHTTTTTAAHTAHHAEEPAGKTKAHLIFGKWDPRTVKITDYSLAKYIDIESKKVPHTFGSHSNKAMAKSKISIVERLINKIMRSGQGKRKLSGKYIRGRGSCGKKQQAMAIVEKAFEIVESQTKENPVQILVKAIERAAPREDTTRLTRGGISYSQAVDIAPIKRIDESLKNIAIAGFAQSFNNKTSASEALAKELVLASKEDPQSFSIKRRDEIERIAKSSR